MNYILRLTTGGEIIINKEEAEVIASANDDQSITLKRLGVVVQKRMCLVFPQNISDEMEDRKKQATGVLHDGTRVKRHFGQWVDYNVMPDESGKFQHVRLDPDYYPEVAIDCVATEKEYDEIKSKGLDYYERMDVYNRRSRIEKREFTPLLT